MPLLNKIKSQYSRLLMKYISPSFENDIEKVDSFLEQGTFHFMDITFENLEYRN